MVNTQSQSHVRNRNAEENSLYLSEAHLIHRLLIGRPSGIIESSDPGCLNTLSHSRVQELTGDGQREAGRIPRTIECELTSDLVDSCTPGDMVTITAVVKATGSDEGIPYNHPHSISPSIH